jgi:hypothetical protein
VLLVGYGQAVGEKNRLIDAEAPTVNIEGVFAGNGDSFGPMGSIPPLNGGDQSAQRRSQRVMVKVFVTVLAEGSDKKCLRFAIREREKRSLVGWSM